MKELESKYNYLAPSNNYKGLVWHNYHSIYPRHSTIKIEKRERKLIVERSRRNQGGGG